MQTDFSRWIVILIAGLTMAIGCGGNAAFEQVSEARHLAADLQVKFCESGHALTKRGFTGTR